MLRADTAAATPNWQPADVNCGLPLRDRTRFEATESVATGGGLVLAGGERGVYRSADATHWTAAAAGRRTRR